MQQCLQANCPPPPPYSFTHQTLLGRVFGMLSILTAAMYGRQFHQSFTQVGYIMHSLTWYSRSFEEISGSDHSFVGFLCHPETTEQPHFEDCSRVLLQVWFFWRISWNLFTGAFFSFLFFFSFVMYLNW